MGGLIFFTERKSWMEGPEPSDNQRSLITHRPKLIPGWGILTNPRIWGLDQGQQ
jgi:hypothetical protein